MKTIAFICPYFGKLPSDTFRLWLLCCKFNTSINWLLFTDDRTSFDYPANVKVVYTTLKDFSSRIQKKFAFNISISSPYKLCDFKPTYGYVFDEELKGYDYWGHCDLSDCIFGDLRKFLTDDYLCSAEKLLFLGHMTIYRNTPDVNERIFLPTKSGKTLDYILNGENKAFDELNPYSINTIYLENGYKISRQDQMYVDVSPMRYAFQQSCYDSDFKQYYAKKEPMIFEWNNGKLFECKVRGSEVAKREIGYVHFQKRKIRFIGSMSQERFVIRPNFFDFVFKDVSVKNLQCCSKNRFFYLPFFKLKYKALKYHLARLIWGNPK